jgi:hypothetical protein
VPYYPYQPYYPYPYTTWISANPTIGPNISINEGVSSDSITYTQNDLDQLRVDGQLSYTLNA